VFARGQHKRSKSKIKRGKNHLRRKTKSKTRALREKKSVFVSVVLLQRKSNSILTAHTYSENLMVMNAVSALLHALRIKVPMKTTFN